MARFIVSNRLAGKVTPQQQEDSRSSLEDSLNSMRAFASFDARRGARSQAARRTLVIESDPREVQVKKQEFPPDVMLEPEILHTPQAIVRRNAAEVEPAILASASAVTGIGALFELNVTAGGSPLAGAQVNVLLSNPANGAQTMVVSVTDARGKAPIAFNPGQWVPAVAIISPKENYWSWWQSRPQNHMVIDVPPLPRSGPLGWWHQVMGVLQYSEQRGQGIRVGVADTGVGPNPFLSHVQSIGSFINGGHNSDPASGLDVEDHGTHVSGIIAARPPADSGYFAGIAPGASVYVARVFPNKEESSGGPSLANQGDISAALDALSLNFKTDLINLSLGSSTPSEIEQDALQVALERGTLVLCAAGNGNGAPVMYPAAFPQAVGISALGLLNTVPPGSLASMSVPSSPDHFSTGGLYVAGFSNVGPQIRCAGPGVGIVSTAPSGSAGEIAYIDMSGTSMATPAVTALCAVALSEDTVYRDLPRNASRAQRAWMIFAHTLRSLGLNAIYQGYGLPVNPWQQS